MGREKVVAIMRSWLNAKKGGSVHKHIIDMYNTIKPIPSGYKMTYQANWCAATISAAYKEAGYDSIFPSECSCSRMIKKAKNMGIWIENDAYKPMPGDGVIYDWDDNGKGDCTGAPEHIGMVVSVDGASFKVIEGNKGKPSAVGIRTMNINGRYIRGFVVPKFSEDTKKKTNDQIAKEVYNGLWGNGQKRKDALKEAGYDPEEIQKLVNKMVL